MPTYYPHLGGITTALPYSAEFRFDTVFSELESGQRHSRSNLNQELGRWLVTHNSLSDADVAVLETFFAGRHGPARKFTYLDPGGNLVRFSENFADASWIKTQVSVGASTTDPFGGNGAVSASSTGSGGRLTAVVLPEGQAQGLTLNASVFVRPASAQQMAIGFRSGAATLSSEVFSLAGGIWRRISTTHTVSVGGVVEIMIGGEGTWTAGQTIDLFGAQVSPMPGPGDYVKTPGNLGLHDNCRFASEEFSPEVFSPGLSRIQLEIVEFGG